MRCLVGDALPPEALAALTSAEVKRLLAACGADTAGHRDLALLLLGFAGALRRSEIVVIDREHLRFTSEGMTVFIPRSKRDREGTTIGIPRGLNPLSCPVRAMEVWLRRTRIERRSLGQVHRLGALSRRRPAARELAGAILRVDALLGATTAWKDSCTRRTLKGSRSPEAVARLDGRWDVVLGEGDASKILHIEAAAQATGRYLRRK